MKSENKTVRVEQVVNFLNSRINTEFSKDIEENFHTHHPRYEALEIMSESILDIGAGDGGMGQLLYWPKVQDNKSLTGCDLVLKNHLPKGYSDWISGGWEKIGLSHKFGGVLAIHVIEHLDSWELMLKRAIDVLNEGQYIYIEWPVMESISWPSASEVWEIFKSAQGKYPVQLLSTLNFYDDDTHIDKPPSMESVIDSVSILKILKKDRILLPELAEDLVSKGLKEQSVANVTMGVWAKFGFAQYILAQKKVKRFE